MRPCYICYFSQIAYEIIITAFGGIEARPQSNVLEVVSAGVGLGWVGLVFPASHQRT